MADSLPHGSDDAPTIDYQVDPRAGRELATPERIGPYRILQLLGRGGMGSVYLAEQREPIRRRVALKVIKLGMDSGEVLRRFELERQALAVMNHDAITRVFDAGTTERGQAYFVMEFVEGQPLTTYCDDHRLTLAQRVELFERVCAGVQHAHHKGVVHRDLKPGNILAARRGDDHAVKIIDFGIARATDHQLVDATLFTEHGVLLGTPEYMSPEQASGSPLEIDTRTDIYSLGVVLYELLTGELPFPGDELRRVGLAEMQRVIREREPPKPSTRVAPTRGLTTGSADRRRTNAPALQRSLRGDLDWIVMKAMAKEPERRYESANALALDLARYRACEPVLAGPPSVAYRMRKFARRYRGRLVAAGLLLASLMVGGVVATVLAIENADLAREKTELARAEAAQRRSAESSLGRFNQLRHVVVLKHAVLAESDTFPAWPDRQDAIRAWLHDHGEPLSAARPELERALAEFAPGTLPPEDEFLRSTLAELCADLRTFESDTLAAVRQRADWAARIGELTRAHPGARTTWRVAHDAIRSADGVRAHAAYRSDPPLELTPQIGLVPIGMNPVTKLWEFYHLRSAWDPNGIVAPDALEIPIHRDDGHIELDEDTGIVFVLVPGGTAWLGAQSSDPNGQNYDPMAVNDETPYRVTLAPFFIARHELTQGQYERLTGEADPSAFGQGWGNPAAMQSPVDRTHPVERLDWEMANRAMVRHGLELPTEAQWEYACRAGSETPWWTGRERNSLIAHGIAANLADRAAVRAGAGWPALDDWPDLDDGWAIHARADALRANPWGLHHVHGNVCEWCRDAHSSYRDVTPRTGDGLREPGSVTARIYRGGGFGSAAPYARSAHRDADAPAIRGDNLGLRASRAVL